jgi:hypothetical protein
MQPRSLAVILVALSIVWGFSCSSLVHATTIGFWRFEEGVPNSIASPGNPITDSSGNGAIGTPIGGPIYRAVTNPNSTIALDFDGIDDQIMIPDAPQFALTRSLTIEAFIYPRSIPPTWQYWAQILFRGDDRGGLDPYFLTLRTDGTVTFHIEDANHQYAEVATPLPALNQWLHVAGTLNDATGDLSVYVDGMLMNRIQTSIRPFAALDPALIPGLGIGRLQSTSPGNPQFFNGLIDEVRLSDTALNPSQFLNAPSSSVPEPSTLLLLGSGVVGIGLWMKQGTR